MNFQLFQQATKEHAKAVRKIAKAHGIKKCRLVGHSVFIGSQLELIEKEVALKLIEDLNKAGYKSEIQSIINGIVEENNLCGLLVRKFTNHG